MKYVMRPMERRRDMPQVLRIERASFPDPWDQKDFARSLTENQGMICEQGGEIVGYMIYRFDKDCYSLINVAVDPTMRRQGVGRFMVQSVIEKMTEHQRDCIEATIGENNLVAHLFMRQLGFKAQRVLRNFFDGQDGYDFVYRNANAPVRKMKHEDQLCRGR